MVNVLGRVLALVVLGIVLGFPALSFTGDPADAAREAAEAAAEEPTTITSYEAAFDLAEDGDLGVVETITVDFPIAPDRRGIFRFWDRLDTAAPHARREAEDIEVTFDGGPVEVDEFTEQARRFTVAKVGSENEIVEPGEHVYEISYRIPGVIEPGDDDETEARSQFYWQLVPAGWLQDIERSRITVDLPAAAADDVQCVVGLGEGRPCEVQGAGTDRLVVETGAIENNTPVTVLVGLDIPTPPPGKEVPWTGRWDPVLGTSPLLLGLVVLLSVAGAVVTAVLARRTYERDPQFPLMYAPPEGIGPAQAAFLLREDVDRRTYVATLLHAAERGVLDLRRDGEVWALTDRAGDGPENWHALDEVTRGVCRIAGGDGATFVADPRDVGAGKELKSAISSFEEDTEAWAVRSGNFTKQPLNSLMLVVVVLCAAAAVANSIWNPFGMSALGLLPGLVAVAGVPFLSTGADTQRTRQGRDLWSRVGGFHRVLSTSSSQQRFEFSGREELYTAYVPWAAAFGCADVWAEKFRTEMGHEPPGPAYIGGYYGGYAAGADAIVRDFDHTLDSAIDAYDATQKSSSSGGGGFSGGGGGGGGGGGSW